MGACTSTGVYSHYSEVLAGIVVVCKPRRHFPSPFFAGKNNVCEPERDLDFRDITRIVFVSQ
jgi:hypothetical protein